MMHKNALTKIQYMNNSACRKMQSSIFMRSFKKTSSRQLKHSANHGSQRQVGGFQGLGTGIELELRL
jgi:hypothetical protein